MIMRIPVTLTKLRALMRPAVSYVAVEDKSERCHLSTECHGVVASENYDRCEENLLTSHGAGFLAGSGFLSVYRHRLSHLPEHVQRVGLGIHHRSQC